VRKNVAEHQAAGQEERQVKEARKRMEFIPGEPERRLA